MRERFAEAWTLERLGCETACEPRELAASFERMFGCSPKEYLRRVRVDRAVIQVHAGEKIECIPGDVGYKSRKDMNAAFTRVIGVPPSHIRRMSAAELETLRHRIQAPWPRQRMATGTALRDS